MTKDDMLPKLVSGFFLKRLVDEKGASRNTILTYRDGMRMFLAYLGDSCGPAFGLGDMTAERVVSFLDEYEKGCHHGTRSRNLRLAMIKSFAKYIQYAVPDRTDEMNRILAIGMKRCTQKVIQWLTREETDALLKTARDYMDGAYYPMLSFMYQTGARVSEIANLKVSQLTLDGMADVVIRGKGNKERRIPLEKPVVKALREMLARRNADGEDYAFVTMRGGRFSRRGIAYALAKVVSIAAKTCPSMAQKRISPHSIRHTTAMHLLEKGADINTVRLWLGHVSIETTNIYVESDIELKRKVLERARFGLSAFISKHKKVGDDVYAFLESL